MLKLILRGEDGTRTHDPLHAMQVLYPTELHPRFSERKENRVNEIIQMRFTTENTEDHGEDLCVTLCSPCLGGNI